MFLITDGAGNPYLASVRKDVKTYSNRWLEYVNILNKHAILAIVTNSNHLFISVVFSWGKYSVVGAYIFISFCMWQYICCI